MARIVNVVLIVISLGLIALGAEMLREAWVGSLMVGSAGFSLDLLRAQLIFEMPACAALIMGWVGLCLRLPKPQ